MVKREQKDELSETGSELDTDQTAVESSRKRAKPSPTKSKGKTPSPAQTTHSSPPPLQTSSGRSAKSKLGEMIIECGIKSLSKAEAQIRVDPSTFCK